MCKQGSVPEDRQTAIYIAALRQEVSAGPQRQQSKAQMLWVPSRWQLADAFTKPGLSEALREVLMQNKTRLHEPSAQAIKRAKATIDPKAKL
jgi:hypothetical protein